MDILRTTNKPHPSSPRPSPQAPRGVVSRTGYLLKIVGVTAGIIIALGLVGGGFVMLKHTLWSTEKAINSGGFQAVFLTNNQVYFGHLKNVNNTYLLMTTVYYLQVQSTGAPKTTDQLPQEASLSKLGNEVHGPEDAMYIARDQVLFWENLRPDSKVVQAIKQGEKK